MLNLKSMIIGYRNGIYLMTPNEYQMKCMWNSFIFNYNLLDIEQDELRP